MLVVIRQPRAMLEETFGDHQRGVFQACLNPWRGRAGEQLLAALAARDLGGNHEIHPQAYSDRAGI
jgi:hypothetical protein